VDGLTWDLGVHPVGLVDAGERVELPQVAQHRRDVRVQLAAERCSRRKVPGLIGTAAEDRSKAAWRTRSGQPTRGAP
jgi:hypothetical protein